MLRSSANRSRPMRPSPTTVYANHLAANSASFHFLWDASNSPRQACWDCLRRGASWWRGLAPLVHLHKVQKFLLYANARGAIPRGHQSTNRTWALTLLIHYYAGAS